MSAGIWPFFHPSYLRPRITIIGSLLRDIRWLWRLSTFRLHLNLLPEKHGIKNPFQTFGWLCLVHYDLQLAVAVEGVCVAGILIRIQKQLQQLLVAQDPFPHSHRRVDESVCHLQMVEMGKETFTKNNELNSNDMTIDNDDWIWMLSIKFIETGVLAFEPSPNHCWRCSAQHIFWQTPQHLIRL